MSNDLEPGTRVRFTCRLGLVAHPNDTRFQEATVDAGDEGTYRGPHPTIPGWSLIAVGEEVENAEAAVAHSNLVCPCHSSHFEVIT